MSTFPELEAALEAAAHRHYGRRRRRFSWRPIVPEAIVVPEATLALSHALTQVPSPSKPIARTPVAHAELPAVAAELQQAIPYPPGLEDRFDWAATPPGPYDMSSINHREDVEMLLEFRAGCIWLGFWLSADAAGRQAATAVLADVPNWPYRRIAGDGSRWPTIAEAAAQGDAAALAEAERGECAGV